MHYVAYVIKNLQSTNELCYVYMYLHAINCDYDGIQYIYSSIKITIKSKVDFLFSAVD